MTTGLPGRASAAWMYMSSVKFVGVSKYRYGIVPWAGIVTSRGSSNTTSGVPIRQPSG